MNVFDLYAKIALDTGDYEKGLEDASEKTSSFADKLKTGKGWSCRHRCGVYRNCRAHKVIYRGICRV